MADPRNDQFGMIIQYVKIILREAYRNKYYVCLGFVATALGVLALGFVSPKQYETSATLFADRTNIIQPLLSGQASITKVNDQARVVKEAIYSPRVLSKVITRSGILSGSESPAEIERHTNSLRDAIEVRGIGGSYIRVSYAAADQDITYNVLKSIVEVFIRDSSDAKRSESRQAYEFINSQVESYKTQLQRAEEKLRAFKVTSVNGTEASVNQRISELRATIESLNLDIEGVRTRIRGVESELGNESQFVVQQQRLSIYRSSLSKAQQDLEIALLSYTDTHPDVLALKSQIEDLQRIIFDTRNQEKSARVDAGAASAAASSVGVGGAGSQDIAVNPLYEELRGELSEAKVAYKTKSRRLQSTKRLLEEERDRLRRVAEGEAELAELNRDYNVTKAIYEDMLERKEKARLSMTLDIEGRGLTYKIQEPPAYPLNASGLTFVHFLMIGPVLGLIFPLGLLVAYILVDPRIRMSSQLHRWEGIDVLGVIAHRKTSIRRRILQLDAIIIGALLMMVCAAYSYAIYLKLA